MKAKSQVPGSFSENRAPKILGFLCNWCAYAGADLAGVSRFQYPPDLRIVRVMCSGRVDPEFVIRAFQLGMDGVAVLGCHPGDCHYQTGNLEAEKKMRMTQSVLEKVGIMRDRLYLDWVSAAEGARFAEVVTNFTRRINEIGPLGGREGLKANELSERLELAQRIVESARMRWLIGKERELLDVGNTYGEKIAEDRLREIIDRNIEDEYNKAQILRSVEKKPATVQQVAEKVDLGPQQVFRYVTYLENQGLVALSGVSGNEPRYMKVAQQ
jgi:F420-non-reducing hydrogenase iron-sulfur subunit